MILPPSFYAQETVSVAKQLLGCYLVHLEGQATTLGRIVEEEPLQIWSADSLPDAPLIEDAEIVQTTRIGIAKAKELPLRFYLKGNRSISRT